jgi:hypothetical protein
MPNYPRPIVQLAGDMQLALDTFEATAKRKCPDECQCPMSQMIRATRAFIAEVDAFEAGELVQKGVATVMDEAMQEWLLARTPPEHAESVDLEGEWYYVGGVRYCSRCQTRRCERQVGGMLPCIVQP